jgi:hypothetical protein
MTAVVSSKGIPGDYMLAGLIVDTSIIRNERCLPRSMGILIARAVCSTGDTAQYERRPDEMKARMIDDTRLG